MREAVDLAGVQTHLGQYFAHALLAILGRANTVDHQSLGHTLAHGDTRVKRGVGILKDNLHITAQRLHLAAVGLEDVLALEEYLASGGLLQPQHRAPSSRLPAAALSHQPQRLATAHVETYVIHRFHRGHRATHDAPLDGEVLFEVAHLNQVLVGRLDLWRCHRLSPSVRHVSNQIDSLSTCIASWCGKSAI